MEYLHFVGLGSHEHSSSPGVTVSGGVKLAIDERELLSAPWLTVRVHREKVTPNPSVSLSTGGSMLVTNRRVVWSTSNFVATGSTKTSLATIAVTDSLIAGWTVGKLSKRRAEKKMKSHGIVAGQINQDWLDYVGYYPKDNFIRLGVRERFTDKFVQISIDLVLPVEVTALTVAQRITETVISRRQASEHVHADFKAQLATKALPAEPPMGKLGGVDLPGWSEVFDSSVS